MLDDGDDGDDVVLCNVMLHGLWHKWFVISIMLDDGDDGNEVV